MKSVFVGKVGGQVVVTNIILNSTQPVQIEINFDKGASAVSGPDMGVITAQLRGSELLK